MAYKPKIRVLVVDDNHVFLKLFTKILHSPVDNYEIEFIDYASNGQECIDKLKNQTYEVVFMDVEMPVMNGIDATKYITDKYRGIQVYAISYNSEIEKIRKILEAGARNYLIKESVTSDVVKQLLEKYPCCIQ